MTLHNLAMKKYPGLMKKEEGKGEFMHIFILTSDTTQIDSIKYLESVNYFGYKKEYIHIF